MGLGRRRLATHRTLVLLLASATCTAFDSPYSLNGTDVAHSTLRGPGSRSRRKGAYAKSTNVTAALADQLQTAAARRLRPTVSVTNVRFTDEQTEGLKIAGTVRWDPPTNWPDEPNRAYKIYIVNKPFDAEPPYSDVDSFLWDAVGEDGYEPNVPFGTNQMIIYPAENGVKRQVLVRGKPTIAFANYIAVVCENGPNNFALASDLDPTAAAPIYDLCDDCGPPPLLIDTSRADGGIQFTDTDMTAGELQGDITWTVPFQDMAYVQYFKVYLATDAQGSNPLVLSETVPMGTHRLSISIPKAREGRDYIRILTTNQDKGDSATAAVAVLYDASSVSPTAQVQNPTFEDQDNNEGIVQGTIDWTPPQDLAPFLVYMIYFAMDATGTGKSLQAEVPAGTNSYTVPANTDRQTRDYLIIHTKNALAGQAGISSNPAVMVLVDNLITKPSDKVASISFHDLNPLFRFIQGTISWVPGDEATPTYYEVYFSVNIDHVNTEDPASWTFVNQTALGTNELAVPANTNINVGSTTYKYIHVYVGNAYGLSDSFTHINLVDDKTTCTLYTCELGYGKKAPELMPEGCANLTCTRDECCDQSGSCSDADFSCSPGWMMKANAPFICAGPMCRDDECCDRGAETPTNVTGTNPAHDSMVVIWDTAPPNDCIFLEYEVYWRPTDGDFNWTANAGCSGLRDICVSQCTATGLPSQTSVQFQVRARCQVDSSVDPPRDLSSSWSEPSAGDTTLPHKAEAPSSLNVYGISHDSAWLTWAPEAPLNDCVAAGWEVVVRIASTGQAVLPAPSCSSASDCTMPGLSCATGYQVQIRRLCVDPLAHSAFSDVAAFTTTRGLTCVLAAGEPTSVLLTEPTKTTMKVSWTAGDPQDCHFVQWGVEVRPDNSARWFAVDGCTGLNSRAVAECTATGLQSNMLHDFRVREECNNTFAFSGWAQAAAGLRTLVRPSEAPEGVGATSPSTAALTVHWEVPQTNDCVFNGYVVQWRLADGATASWAVPEGCTGLINACESVCIATGLPSNAAVEFRVRVACISAAAESDWSNTSVAVATLPVPAMQPTDVNVSDITSTGAQVTWEAASLNDCSFVGWAVVLLDLATGEVVEGAAEACEGLDFGTTTCEVANLTCNTRHSVTVAVECNDTQANSAASTADEFWTPLGGASGCLLPAVRPTSVAAASPTMTSLALSWTAGDARDCAFESWEVQVRPENRALWAPATGCESLLSRGTLQCTATGLQSNTLHGFRVRERCTDDATDSEWSEAAVAVATLVRPADTPENLAAGSPTVNSLLLSWDVPQLHDCVFSGYIVEWQLAGSASAPWAPPEGCTGLTNACESVCVASSLPSLTALIFRIRVGCLETDAESGWSNESEAVSTLPVPAGPPTGLVLSSITASGAVISWQAGALNDCVFADWAITVRDVSQDQVVDGAAAACTGLDFGTLTCQLANLACNTNHSVTVAAQCNDPLANSLPSGAASFVTIMGGASCMLAALQPSNVVAANAAMTSLDLSWTAGLPRDCSFTSWEVEVRPENRASWAPAQGCSSLTPRSVLQCTATGLESNRLHEFRVRERCTDSQADSPWGTTAASVATLVRPADAPVNLAAGTPTLNSLVLHWDVPQVNDCAFSNYVVQWRLADNPSAAWAVPGGCAGLTNFCESVCTADLPSNTRAVFRVRVACASASAESGWSALSAAAATLPLPAARPTGVSLISSIVSWQASTLNHCTFAGWAVVVRDLVQGQAVPGATEACEGLDFATRSCEVANLTCNTPHEVTVAVECVDPNANSPPSTAATFLTTEGGSSCLLPAILPGNVTASSPTMTTLNLTWTPGAARDCTFAGWEVQVRPENRAIWSAAQGCMVLTSRATTECTASGLQSNTLHEVRVRELCIDADTNSLWGMSSSPVVTLARPAEAPADVVVSTPAVSSLLVQWGVPLINDCIFRQYLVQWQPADGSLAWAVPSGCAGAEVRSSCSAFCTAGGLPSNTDIVFRVKVECQNAGSESPFSSVSPVQATLPLAAAPPSGVVVPAGSITDEEAEVTWQAGALNDCTFAFWDVVVTNVQSGDVVSPQTACEAVGASGGQCNVSGLGCDSDYAVKVGARCTDANANSGHSAEVSFKTLRGLDCGRPASKPASVFGTDESYTTLRAVWTPGAANDCVFERWHVEFRTPGANPGDADVLVTPQGCSGLSSRAVSDCLATGLHENTRYFVRVQEVCTDGRLSSAVGESPTAATTRLVPQPQVIMQDPMPGTSVAQRVEQVLLIFSELVELNGTAELQISSINTTDHCAMGAESSTEGFRLQNGRIALWPVNRSLWQQGCHYRFDLAGGLFATTLKPAKAVVPLSWDFAFNALVPTFVQVELLSSAPEALTVAVAWDLNVVFRCGAAPLGAGGSGDVSESFVAVTGELGAFKDDPVSVTFSGLAPTAVYAVYCLAEVQEDRLVRSTWLLAGSWATPPDENRHLSSLTLRAARECPGGDVGEFEDIPLSPAFDKSHLEYEAAVAAVDPQSACSSQQGTDAVWRVELVPVLDSAYASSNVSWEGGATLSQSSRRITLPLDAAFAEMNTSVHVFAMAPHLPPLEYRISILALQVQFTVSAPRFFNPSGAEVASGTPVEENWRLEVDVSYSGVQIPMELWTRLVVYVGPFNQNTIVRTVDSGQQLYTLEVQQVLGMGVELPVRILLEGTSVGEASGSVSFVESTVSCVSDSQAFGICDTGEITVSAVNSTVLYVRGFGFGNHPLLYLEPGPASQVLRLSVTSLAENASGVELCSSPLWLSSTQLQCTLMPVAPPPLELALFGPKGSEVTKLLTVPWEVNYQTPTVYSATQAVLPITTEGDSTDLYIVGEGFPDFEEGELEIELRSGARRLGRALAVAHVKPCREVIRVNDTHVLCRLADHLDLSDLSCRKPELVITFGGLETVLQVGGVEVPAPNITAVTAPTGPHGPVEVGTALTYELLGVGFGTASNGPLLVQVGSAACTVLNRSDDRVKCQANGPLLADIEGSYPRVSEVNSSDGMVRVAVSASVSATLGNPGHGCDPVSDTWPHLKLQLLPCSPGNRRVGMDVVGCVPCGRGEFQSLNGPFLTCESCPVGKYQDETGQTTCKSCPTHKTTVGVATLSLEGCLCEVGHFLPSGATEPDSACSICPDGAHCAGSSTPPVALVNYWLHADYSVTPCTLQGCLGNNTCAVGYMEAARCENCEVSWYPDIVVNACQRCSAWVPFVTWTYAVFAFLFITLVIVPLIAWKARRELNPGMTEVPWICFGSMKHCLEAMFFGLTYTNTDSSPTIEVTDEASWPRTRRVMLWLKCLEWSQVKGLIEGAEFQRVVNIVVNNTQILYLVAGVGVKFWPGPVQDLVVHMSYVLGDIETLKPDCFLTLPAPIRWFIVWALPYFLYIVFILAIACQRSAKRDRAKITMMISGAALLYMFPPHLMSIMQAFDCVQISDGHSTWVLENDRSVYCYRYFGLSDDPDYLWSTMATVAGVDLLFLCTIMCYVGHAVYKSYWWYREKELGSKPPTSVFLTWWWVVGCRGFSAKHRYAVRGLKTQLATSPMGLAPSEVGGLCEDLFTRNLTELRAGLSSMACDLKSSKLWQFLDATAGQDLPRVAKRPRASERKAGYARSSTASRSMISISEEVYRGLTTQPKGAASAPWQRRQALRRNAYTTLAAQLESIASSWRTMSSFATHETASLLSYMWEVVNVVNKIGLSIIRLYTTHDPGIGMRAACFWCFFFTVLVYSVRPYRHDGLNVLDSTFSALISFLVASVLVLELWEDEPSSQSTVHFFFQLVNFLLVMCVLVLALLMLVAYTYYYLRELAFKEALYVLDPDSMDPGSSGADEGGRHEAGPPKLHSRVMSRVVQSKAEVMSCDGNLKAQWMFCSCNMPGTSTIVLEQGVGLTVRNEALLHRILDAEGGPISMAEPLPSELQGLKGCGEFTLTRGGDLTGRMVLRLNGKLEQNLSELWKLQEQRNDFVLQDDLRIAGKDVPIGAKLTMVRFAPPGTPEHLARNELPAEFLDKLETGGDSALHGVQGLLVLEFLRPDTMEDVHLELCEMILSRDEVPMEAGTDQASVSSLPPPPTMLARTVPPEIVLPLVLRLAPQQPQIPLHVFKEPAFGCFDKVLILGRYGQQWLLRAAELDLRLGLSSELIGQSEEHRRNAKASKEEHSRYQGFVRRSVWRTRDGGIIVVHNGQCWGGQIDVDKQEDAYHVEVNELYGMPVTWKVRRTSGEAAVVVPGWFDGECIHWFESQFQQQEVSVDLEDEWMQRQLPPGPWVRIRSASEEGVPGPDGGLWTLITHFYTECHGALPRWHLERVAEHQATTGARELFVRTTQDSLFEKAKHDMVVPFLSPADLNAVVGQTANNTSLSDELVRENSYSTLASMTPRGRLTRASSTVSRVPSRPGSPQVLRGGSAEMMRGGSAEIMRGGSAEVLRGGSAEILGMPASPLTHGRGRGGELGITRLLQRSVSGMEEVPFFASMDSQQSARQIGTRFEPLEEEACMTPEMPQTQRIQEL